MSKNEAHPVHVLVVDDDLELLPELQELIEALGYGCMTASTPAEAKARFLENPRVGIILCDLHLPGHNGIQCVQQLSEQGLEARAFEAAILTGNSDEKYVIDAMRAGFSDFLSKPITFEDLQQTLSRLAQRLERRNKDLHRTQLLKERLLLLSEAFQKTFSDFPDLGHEVSARSAHSLESSGGRSYLQHDHKRHSFHVEEHSMAESVASSLQLNQLTRRQLEVAMAVGKGMTNYQIACDLGLTENTVKLYVSQILRLTHTTNRTQLAIALAPLAQNPER